MKVEWTKLEKDHEPPTKELWGKLVWVIEQFYNEGVVVGRYRGDGWEVSTDSDGWFDDCLVTHYAVMEIPDPPEGWSSEDIEDDEDIEDAHPED